MRFSPMPLPRPVASMGFLLLAALLPAAARAQLQITEVMHSPGGADALWEWIEIRNTSASPINLDGWVFDDDDEASIGATAGANILAANGNTIVPAGGIAVLYAGNDLNYTPSRFTDAWGPGITLIPVRDFTSLTDADAIGLWPSHAAYTADTIPDAMTAPRRTFNNAAVSLDYSTSFPEARSPRSLAWKGTGSFTDGSQWVESVVGEFQAFLSGETILASAPINDTTDRGNPGMLPTGPAPAGLLITEIMFAPASPATGATGWTSADFEWIELYNNSGSTKNLAGYVFDDFEGELAASNIAGGSLAQGQSAILFNGEMLTTENMATMWGAGRNYIPVNPWPSLNNTGGDTIGLWEDHDTYLDEAIDDEDHRATDLAVASVVYNTVNAQGWPTISPGSSIYLNNLTADPNVGASWTRSGHASDTLATFHAALFEQTTVDHPGDDIGSPGKVGAATAAIPGDYNHDGRVDAGDYVRWRNNLGDPNENDIHNNGDGGGVGISDYAHWKARYGTPGNGGIVTPVPEPGPTLLLAIGLAFMPPARPARRSPPRCPAPKSAADARRSPRPAPGRPAG